MNADQMTEKSLEIQDWDRNHLIHPLSFLKKQTKKALSTVVKGEGVWVTLSNGTRLLDGFSGLLCVNVGYGREEIKRAVQKQMDAISFYPSFWDFSNEPAAALAKCLADLLPKDRKLRYSIFGSSGSDANEANIAIARLYHMARGYPLKRKIISRRWSFHGTTYTTNRATGLEVYQSLSPSDPNFIHAASAYCDRCEFGRQPTSCGFVCVDDIAKAIEDAGADTVAAIIVEAIPASSGVLVPPQGYFEVLQEICRRHDILLILDEVVTGFGRTGQWFGMEHYGIYPDLVSFGKAITSGYIPLSAATMSESIFQVISTQAPHGLPFLYGMTFQNHPVACAAALANIELIRKEELVTKAKAMGEYLLSQLRERFGGSTLCRSVRGQGLLTQIEIKSAKQDGFVPNTTVVRWLTSKCLEYGLIVGGTPQGLCIAPPLNIAQNELDELLERLEKVWIIAENRF